jgi:hypothetical protein
MARGRAGQKKKAIRRRHPRDAKTAVATFAKPAHASSGGPVNGAPVRGVKLKTVSLFTVVFALVCLGAFVAGRPPALAEAVAAHRTSSAPFSAGRLRHDDGRSLLRHRRSRERKAGSQEFEKSP